MQNKPRYFEDLDGGSNLLWPSEIEDQVTRSFYRDLSHLSKRNQANQKKKNIISQIFTIVSGRGASPLGKS
mgnify:CR=1 FL=1|tara:strand:+ start:8637 stop:8849 length:213 start_codon:yes stop_codon:yes gene_type:complete